MTTLVTEQRSPQGKIDEDLAALECLSLRLAAELDNSAVTDDEINRLIDEERPARYQERLAARKGSRQRA